MKQNIKMEIKEISDIGVFSGRLSVYGEVDQGNDIVDSGAFTKTIKERGNQIPMLWQHKSDVPIGMLDLEDTFESLNVTGRLLMDLPEAQKAYLLIKSKIVRGLSIGFEAIKDSVEAGVRHLKEIKLYEGSVVTFPMLESALITSIKKLSLEVKGDFNEEFLERQLYATGDMMRSALDCALRSAMWAGLSKDEIVTASQAVIEQFSSAYMAFLPSYIDLIESEYGRPMEQWASGKKLETKAGRMISASNKSKISAAHDHMKSASDILYSLLDLEAEMDGADDATPKSLPVTGAETKHKPEPAADHSAITAALAELKESYQWNSLNRN